MYDKRIQYPLMDLIDYFIEYSILYSTQSSDNLLTSHLFESTCWALKLKKLQYPSECSF